MTFSILHTTARPNAWRAAYDAWLSKADHAENIEYVLVVDERWGFDRNDPELFLWIEERTGNRLAWNTGRKCYVDGVNIAARAASGDIFVQVSDDTFPPEHWDTILGEATQHIGFERCATPAPEFAIWLDLGHNEIERGIMALPVMSKSRFDRLGYVFYPAYESMYCDNDLAEHVQTDELRGLCALVKLRAGFQHIHPNFDGVPSDDVYAHENSGPSYELGAAILKARRACEFGEVRQATRKRIGICVAGQTFSQPWLVHWTRLITSPEFAGAHDVVMNFHYSTNVYMTRMCAARDILQTELDYVLWIDDDQLFTVEQVLQLINDLNCQPQVDMVAGWTLCGTDYFSTAEQLSCTLLGKEHRLNVAEDLEAGGDLQELAYTGFPLVLMRWEMLKRLGPQAFLAYGEMNGLPRGEDVSFCLRAREAGMHLAVDRRVKLPHLKLRDICGVHTAEALKV